VQPDILCSNSTILPGSARFYAPLCTKRASTHDAVLSPDAAPPLGRQNLRTGGRSSGRAVAKKKKSREARGASSRQRGKDFYPQTMLEF